MSIESDTRTFACVNHHKGRFYIHSVLSNVNVSCSMKNVSFWLGVELTTDRVRRYTR